MRDVLDAVTQDAAKAQRRADENRAKAPDFAAIVDSMRSLYGHGNVTVKWLLTSDGERIGPVPDEIAANPLHGIAEPQAATKETYRGKRK